MNKDNVKFFNLLSVVRTYPTFFNLILLAFRHCEQAGDEISRVAESFENGAITTNESKLFLLGFLYGAIDCKQQGYAKCLSGLLKRQQDFACWNQGKWHFDNLGGELHEYD